MDDRPRWVRRKCNCECGCSIHKYTTTSPWTCPICLAHNLSWEPPKPPSDRLYASNILIQTSPSDIPDSCIIHLDIEQGDCTLVRLNRINILIDAGYKDRGRAAARRLKLFGIREINHVILTHSDKDHYGGLTHDDIIAMFTPKTTFYCTYRNEGFLRRKIDKVHPLRRIPTDSFGLLINADDDNTACIHYCPTFIDQESAGTNDTSPLLMVQIGQFGCIIAGDLTITSAAADGLRAFASPKINIQHIGMLLPHHGSYYAFEEGALAKVCSIWPKKVYGVISCSALVHGHPHEELVAEATSLGMKLYITNLFAYREDAAAMHQIRIGGTIDFYGDLLVLPNNRYEDTLMQMFACAGDAPGAVNENPYDLTPLVDYRRAIGPHTRPRGRVAAVKPLILKRERSTTLSVSSGLDQFESACAEAPALVSIENSLLARKEFLERHHISTSINASRNRRPRQEDLMKKWRVEALEVFKTELSWAPERRVESKRSTRRSSIDETERAIDMRVFTHTDLVTKECAVRCAHYKALEYMLEKFSEYHVVNESEILKVVIEVYAELCRTALPDGKPAQIFKLAPLTRYLTKQAAEEGWIT